MRLEPVSREFFLSREQEGSYLLYTLLSAACLVLLPKIEGFFCAEVLEGGFTG